MGKCNSKQSDPDPPQPLVQDELELQHLFESIYEAALKAQYNVQHTHLQNLIHLFPEGENGIHTPECVNVCLSENSKPIRIPLATLMNHKTIGISTIKVKTSTGIKLVANDNIQKQYNLRLNQTDKTTDIEMVIQLDEPSETVHRMLSKMNTMI